MTFQEGERLKTTKIEEKSEKSRSDRVSCLQKEKIPGGLRNSLPNRRVKIGTICDLQVPKRGTSFHIQLRGKKV